MLRPKAKVLPDSALVDRPGKFTHEVVSEQPYYIGAADGAKPEGSLSKGTKVVLLHRGKGPLCQVEDEHGKQVVTAYSGLRALR